MKKVKFDAADDLVLSENKPLSEPMLIQSVIWRQWVTFDTSFSELFEFFLMENINYVAATIVINGTIGITNDHIQSLLLGPWLNMYIVW